MTRHASPDPLAGRATAVSAEGHAFEHEALPHLDALYRFALRLSGAPTDAEDLVQETMLKAFRAWGQFQAGTNVRAWLMTILRNHFISGYRKSRHTERTVDLDDPDMQPVYGLVGEGDPEGSFFSRLVDERVTSVIDGLPPEYRTALVLSDVEGMAYAEIARVLGIPVGTVRSRIFRARRRAQAQLYDYAVAAGYVPRGRAPGSPAGRCRAARRLLADFLKGELTARVALRIRNHLKVCCPCRTCAEFQQNYLAAVESALQRQRCPEDVRQEILRVIDG
jgi:RNA polymerase sigma-70 factor (ECF subfamily)